MREREREREREKREGEREGGGGGGGRLMQTASTHLLYIGLLYNYY